MQNYTKKHIKGIILAGGQGSRLKPLTNTVDKPLLPIKGKPMVLYSIDKLVTSGITDIILVIRSKHASKYFELIGDGKHLGANSVTYVYHPEVSYGMPFAIGLAEHLIAEDESIIVLCADVLFEQDLNIPIASFRQMISGALVLAAYTEDSAGFSLMEAHDSNITKIFDKDTSRHVAGLIDLGVGMYDHDVFSKISKLDWTSREVGIWELNRKYVELEQLRIFEVTGDWADVGKSREYYESVKRQPRILVIGAGIAGLAAAITLRKSGYEPIILEKEAVAGGLFSNSSVDGCDFDYGPKILLLDDSENSKEILNYLGDNYQELPIQESVYLKDYGLLSFPLQRHLVELPISLRKQIVEELVDTKNNNFEVSNFRDWLISNFGKSLSELVLIPYEEKKWQTDLTEMDYRWALKRPIKTTLDEMLEGAQVSLPPKGKYYYPKQGNITTLTNELTSAAGEIKTNSKIEKIDITNKLITTQDSIYTFDAVISTIPLDIFVSKTSSLPKVLRTNTEKYLKKLSIVILNLVFEGNYDLDGTAIYFPESDFIFRRVSVLENLCPALKRNGKTPISVEVSINPNLPFSQEEIYNTVLEDLAKIPQFEKLGTPVAHEFKWVDFAYPMQIKGHATHVGELHRYYSVHDIYHCGRGGSYNYCNGDEAYFTGVLTAKRVMNNFSYSKNEINKLSVTVGIPSYKSGTSLIETVKSILESNTIYDINIMVSVDGPEMDQEVFEYLRKNKVTIIENEERQGQTARNAQIANLTNTDILILTQDDVVFEQNTVDKIITAFQNDKQLTMIAPYISPLPAKVAFENIVSVGVSLSRKALTNWNNGDNYLSSIGRCLAFRTEFIQQFEIDERIVNCDAYYYFENKRLGGRFLYLKEASVLYRLPQNMEDHLKQVRKFIVSQKELSNFLRTDLSTEYRIPRSILLKAMISEFFSSPIKFMQYMRISYIARNQPKEFYESVTRFWEIDKTTKNL